MENSIEHEPSYMSFLKILSTITIFGLAMFFGFLPYKWYKKIFKKKMKVFYI